MGVSLVKGANFTYLIPSHHTRHLLPRESKPIAELFHALNATDIISFFLELSALPSTPKEDGLILECNTPALLERLRLPTVFPFRFLWFRIFRLPSRPFDDQTKTLNSHKCSKYSLLLSQSTLSGSSGLKILQIHQNQAKSSKRLKSGTEKSGHANDP